MKTVLVKLVSLTEIAAVKFPPPPPPLRHAVKAVCLQFAAAYIFIIIAVIQLILLKEKEKYLNTLDVNQYKKP